MRLKNLRGLIRLHIAAAKRNPSICPVQQHSIANLGDRLSFGSVGKAASMAAEPPVALHARLGHG